MVVLVEYIGIPFGVFIVLMIVLTTVLCSVRRYIQHREKVRQRSVSSQFWTNGSVEKEDIGDREWTHLPPPTYNNANQYQKLDLEHGEVMMNQPPNYIQSSRSQNVFQLPKGVSDLPPPYSTVAK